MAEKGLLGRFFGKQDSETTQPTQTTSTSRIRGIHASPSPSKEGTTVDPETRQPGVKTEQIDTESTTSDDYSFIDEIFDEEFGVSQTAQTESQVEAETPRISEQEVDSIISQAVEAQQQLDEQAVQQIEQRKQAQRQARTRQTFNDIVSSVESPSPSSSQATTQKSERPQSPIPQMRSRQKESGWEDILDQVGSSQEAELSPADKSENRIRKILMGASTGTTSRTEKTESRSRQGKRRGLVELAKEDKKMQEQHEAELQRLRERGKIYSVSQPSQETDK